MFADGHSRFHLLAARRTLAHLQGHIRPFALDAQGNAWYSNFGEQAVGELDPKTGKVTEFSVPILKPGFPTGALALEPDSVVLGGGNAAKLYSIAI